MKIYINSMDFHILFHPYFFFCKQFGSNAFVRLQKYQILVLFLVIFVVVLISTTRMWKIYWISCIYGWNLGFFRTDPPIKADVWDFICSFCKINSWWSAFNAILISILPIKSFTVSVNVLSSSYSVKIWSGSTYGKS